ncbi:MULTISPECIES: low temperature requirement protein A [Glycomyces]|uniref:Low temperature requirement protein LtrA n=2 Tax=Glycomyces TaxID=58113 RepID=A0ABU2ATL7_9ACTN|nr:low temperature requirement protein A [Glycomyces lechevalierae]MDR7340561.1 low temperature requirement protein LtrA [Glycomyces lechevalierae]
MTRILPSWFVERVNPVPDEDDLRVSTLELFFDLIFVFIIAQFTAIIAHDPLLGLLQATLMFGFLWWMYAGYSWLTNVIPPVRPFRRILMLCAMAGWLLVGLTVPAGFEEGSVWLGVGMLVVAVIHGVLYSQSTNKVGSVVLCNILAAFAVIASQLVDDGPWRYALWALSAAIVWSVPIWHGQRGLNLHPAHITERHGLVVLIVLGESVVAIGVGSRGLPIDADLLIAAILGLVICSCLWWSLFVRDMPGTEHVLKATTDPVRRVRKVLAGLSYAFVPVLMGILVLAAGIEHAVGHATEPLDLASTLLLSGGVAMFMLGTAGLRLSMPLPRPWERIVLAVAVLAVAPLGLLNTALQLGAIVIVLVAALAIEGRRATASTPALSE